MRWVPTDNWPDGRRWELFIGDRLVGHVCRERDTARTYAKVTGRSPRVDSTEPCMRAAALWLLNSGAIHVPPLEKLCEEGELNPHAVAGASTSSKRG